MNYYLIDFENVRTEGIKNLNQLSQEDSIIIFYSEQCKSITLDIIEKITNSSTQLSCQKVKTGSKNALDFQLSSYLGYLIGKQEEASYTIISNDKGFDCLCDYWKDQKKSVTRLSPAELNKPVEIKTKKKKTITKVKDTDLATLEEIEEVLESEDEPSIVLDIFNQFKTRVAINNALSKQFKDTKRASAIYKKLKPLLKSKNKS